MNWIKCKRYAIIPKNICPRITCLHHKILLAQIERTSFYLVNGGEKNLLEDLWNQLLQVSCIFRCKWISMKNLFIFLIHYFRFVRCFKYFPNKKCSGIGRFGKRVKTFWYRKKNCIYIHTYILYHKSYTLQWSVLGKDVRSWKRWRSVWIHSPHHEKASNTRSRFRLQLNWQKFEEEVSRFRIVQSCRR